MSGVSPTRLALRPEETAAALGVSMDYFREYIAHELRAVRRGRIKLYPVPDIERWLDQEAALALGGQR